ncbi:Alanine aminotransferase [Lasiodiplodia theobromae]|nr:Alanine aminotransferase [Lasiodiplodia theobromae]KAF4535224.1 Alanine aminotransferase [Lasiodiplodia theobromae]
MGEPQYAKNPDLQLSQHIFHITNPYSSKATQDSSLKILQDAIKEHKMAPLYRHLAHPSEGILNAPGEGSTQQPVRPRRASSSIGSLLAPTKQPALNVTLPWDEKLYEELKADNEKELEAIQKEEEEAVEKAGETEIQTARGKRAEFWTRVGDKDKAIAAYEAVFENTGILGTKIDIVLAIIRVGLFFGDKVLVKTSVERATTLVESGGDWDRRNRLKAYSGLHYLTIRSYNQAAPLLLDSLSTFTSYELCSYSNLVIYAVLAGSVSLKRVDFKSKVVDAPEIKAILGEGEEKLSALTGAISSGPAAGDEEMPEAKATSSTPGQAAVNLTTLGQTNPDTEAQIDFSPLANLVNSLYQGNYRSFFLALAAVEENFLSKDRYLYEHRGWFVREMRLRGYQQLLQSYRVVGLQSMANDFGVSVDFLDKDLSKFIAADRVPCTVDRVRGIIETNRPDDKNKQYNDVVKQGDQLITKLQKYGQTERVTAMTVRRLTLGRAVRAFQSCERVTPAALPSPICGRKPSSPRARSLPHCANPSCPCADDGDMCSVTGQPVSFPSTAAFSLGAQTRLSSFSPHFPAAARTFSSTQTLKMKALTINNINPHVKAAKYAVRGELAVKSEEYRARLARGEKGDLPFDTIIPANIGNPQQLDQKPLTFFRQVASLIENPLLLEHEDVLRNGLGYKQDVIDRARKLLKDVGSVGAYSQSQGSPAVREEVAKYIERRDGFPADPANIFLSAGASSGVNALLHIICENEKSGVLVPIPQYPLYTATLSVLNAQAVPYYLDESTHWGTSLEDIKAGYDKAVAEGIDVRAIVVINPGNPTGASLSSEDIHSVLRFAAEKNLVVMADEVYQTNVFSGKFISFKKALRELQQEEPGKYDELELASLHSISKGMVGECGHRGGYYEMVGFDPEVKAEIYKFVSIQLCAPVIGQCFVEMMVNPPKEGEPSYALYKEEHDGIYKSYHERAMALFEAFKKMEGVECASPAGSMYLFPTITLPEKAIQQAEKEGRKPDEFYTLRMLDATGVCTVPGSGFGQRDGTWHFRTTFLAPGTEWIGRIVEFHRKFMDEFR